MEEERNLKITLDKARVWYYGDNKALKNLALSLFTEDEIKEDWRNIRTLEDAKKYVISYPNPDLDVVAQACHQNYQRNVTALINLNIILRALNGRKYKWYDDAWVTDVCIISDEKEYLRIAGRMEPLGAVRIDGRLHYITMGVSRKRDNIFGLTSKGSYEYGDTRSYFGHIDSNYSYLACRTKEISEHFAKYFYKEIVEFVLTKYTDKYEWVSCY
jgi:hypothetical protein